MFGPEFIIRIPIILFALTIHELAHGWVAWRLGDSTARDQGRLTLNPLSHLDPIGTLMLLWGPLGWAKPVPVNPYNLSHMRRDTALISLAGPGINLLIAIVGGFALRFLEPVLAPFFSGYYSSIMMMFVGINVGLAVFNLLPIPPLDGSNVLASFIPRAWLPQYVSLMRYVPTIFLSMIVIEWLSSKVGRELPLFSGLIEPIYLPVLRGVFALVFGIHL